MHVYVAVLMECQSLMAAIDGSIIQEIVYTILWVSNWNTVTLSCV